MSLTPGCSILKAPGLDDAGNIDPDAPPTYHIVPDVKVDAFVDGFQNKAEELGPTVVQVISIIDPALGGAAGGILGAILAGLGIYNNMKKKRDKILDEYSEVTTENIGLKAGAIATRQTLEKHVKPNTEIWSAVGPDLRAGHDAGYIMPKQVNDDHTIRS